jgi:hypothetical protein
MDDRPQPGRESTPERSAPSAPRTDERSHNGRGSPSGDERSTADRSSAAKPALTDQERNERWPCG